MGQGFGTHARVLVADWDRNHALSLAAAMHQAGITVVTAFNGKEAVEKAIIVKPSLLVTEPYLGRVSGIQAAACITAALPDCKVLFVSDQASPADIAKAAPHLAFTCARRPLHPVDLLNTIANLLAAGDSASGETPADPANFQPASRRTAVAAQQNAEAA